MLASKSTSSTSARIKLCLAAACFVDGVDLGLFPASFRAMERDMGFTPSELGNLSMKTGIAYCCFSLLWGFLADRVNRKVLLISATAALSVIMVATAHAVHRLWFDLLRISAGAITAVANPVMQSLIAQVVPKEEHGQAFGLLLLGTILAGACASVLVAHLSWRPAYLLTGMVNAAVGGLLWVCQPDIQSSPSSAAAHHGLDGGSLSCGDALQVELKKVSALCRIRTFIVLIASGMVGCIPWSALQFLQLYFESAGYRTTSAAALIACLAGGKAAGAWIGGVIGDMAMQRLPLHGRTFVAQATIALGMASMWVLLRWCPHDPSFFNSTALAAFLFGITSTWNGPALDRPLWAELAPESSATAIALWMFLAGSFSSTMGAPIVGWVADTVLGYKATATQGHDVDATSNASALGTALLICTMLPWTLCLLFYSLVHITYPLDIARRGERRPFAKGIGAGAKSIGSTQPKV
mmetsp:Transcript_50149/g.119390  ORF Transcript_50149/g.119390 Transcript_50149/m.119390 type:complete len:468 (-) Transcript_50149:79-1482(-)